MPSSRSHRARIVTLSVAVCIVVGAGIAYRMHSAHALRAETDDAAITSVAVVTPAAPPATEDLVLPGNVQAWHEATIYARTSGYVKRWLTPMGTKVKEGDLLAELEIPEIDAQLRQAEADLKAAEANAALAQQTAQRWRELLKNNAASQQEQAEKEGDARAKNAALAAAKASRDHLLELVSFKNVTAPFDGLITSRTLDIGMLVNAGSATQQPLFRLVQADRLRIYVRVPQNYAARITPDAKAELHFIDRPGKVYAAEFVKTAEAIDPASRTLLTEFAVDNSKSELLSGGYAEVHIKLPSNSDTFRLPVNALIFRAGGLQVAKVDADNTIHLQSVTMGRDYGNEVEISAGLTASERVVVNPPDSLSNDQKVRVIAAKEAPKTEAKK